MDNLLREFHLNSELHANSIQHSLDKDINLATVNTWYQPEAWDIVTNAIENGLYFPAPPFEDYRDKRTGDRISYEQHLKQEQSGRKVRHLAVLNVNDRICHNAISNVLYSRFNQYTDYKNVSYKKGIGTKNVALELSDALVEYGNYYLIKSDLEGYFDNVPIEQIDKLFDWMESEEPSAIWKPIRYEYHDNRIEINGEMTEKYMSLRQGNPIATLLSNLLLRHIDKEMDNYNVFYRRYCDDIIIVSKTKEETERAFARFLEMLNEIGIGINNDKTERHTQDDWFEFLGFSFKKGMRSISEKTLRNLKLKIKTITTGYAKQLHRPCTDKEIRRMIKKLQRYFFTAFVENQENFGMGVYLFGTVNVEHDLRAIENYIKDCLRACKTNHYIIYGLGYVKRNGYVIDDKNIGQNVKANNEKTQKGSEDDLLKKCGWISLMKMYNDYHTNSDLFENSVYRMTKGL